MNLKITILVDTIDSWIHPWAKALKDQFDAIGHSVSYVGSANEIDNGDIAFLLGCIKLVSDDILHKNKFNLVVHPSDLPKGKGFSPVAWQVLEGKKEIPVVMFDAVPEVDAGDVYLRDVIRLDGTELNKEIKDKQGICTLFMCMKFVEHYDGLVPESQNGNESFYKRRTKEDSRLDPEKTIAEQFDLLRVVDNDRYPAFFYLNGERYILHVFKDNLL
ncbi:MAG: methionyl-tRNA formyltransferase [Gammaproteobacteria bacterium]|nr:methionyl-tRNA formyltransferase [Gammaproteobacteria bacterium]MCF6337246.1 methionyl-tRNA formyltransferase [Gammaproteobacteria bacterium]